MAFLSTINIIGSGITAQHLRLDVISENVTNINTTRTEGGGAYRRKVTVFQAEDGRDRFRNVLARTRDGLVSNARAASTGGVKVVEIGEDPSDFKLKYDPSDPDANEEGYVELPKRSPTPWPPVRPIPPTSPRSMSSRASSAPAWRSGAKLYTEWVRRRGKPSFIWPHSACYGGGAAAPPGHHL